MDIRLDDEKNTKDSKELKKFIEKLMDQIKNNMTHQNMTNEHAKKKYKI